MNTYLFVYCFGNPKIHSVHHSKVIELDIITATEEFNKKRDEDKEATIIAIIKL